MIARKHGVAGWESLPCLWLQTLDRDRRARYGQAACASGSLSMLQRRLPVPVHGDDTHASAFHKASFECLAEGHVLMLQSDKGLSSVRLAEVLGVSQPTAWRMGHALRLMAAREHMLDGTVEIDHFHLGGRPRIPSSVTSKGRIRGRRSTSTRRSSARYVVCLIFRKAAALAGLPELESLLSLGPPTLQPTW